MSGTTYAVCGLLAVPMAWFGGALYDRVPDNLPVFRPMPSFRLERPQVTILLATLATYLMAAWRLADLGWGPLAYYLAFFGMLVTLSVIDLETLRLPDKIVVPMIVVAIPAITALSYAQRHTDAIVYAILGGAVYFGMLLVLHLAVPRGMGFGDVKLAAVMGLSVGWLATNQLTAVVLVLYAMLGGFLLGSVVGLGVFIARRKSRPIPFGPFLAFGVIMTVLFSEALLPAGP